VDGGREALLCGFRPRKPGHAAAGWPSLRGSSWRIPARIDACVIAHMWKGCKGVGGGGTRLRPWKNEKHQPRFVFLGPQLILAIQNNVKRGEK
jgi:hypothetical protein